MQLGTDVLYRQVPGGYQIFREKVVTLKPRPGDITYLKQALQFKGGNIFGNVIKYPNEIRAHVTLPILYWLLIGPKV